MKYMNTRTNIIIHLDNTYYLTEYFPSLLSRMFLSVLKGKAGQQELFSYAHSPAGSLQPWYRKSKISIVVCRYSICTLVGAVRDFAIMGGTRPCNNEVPRRGQRITK